LSVLFSLRDTVVQFNGTDILRHISFELPESQLVAIVGPNGAGKSTLLSLMAGLRLQYKGRCAYRAREVSRWPRRAFAREVSFVPQTFHLEFPFSAEQVVLMGRTPYGNGLFETLEDREAVQKAMLTTDTLAFRSRDFRSLSAGEKQRVILASVLAQSPRVLLLDEPTTFLDLEHQVVVYGLLRRLCREGLLVVSVTHDLNLAGAYADRVVMLRSGEVVADADPEAVLTVENIREVFSVEVEINKTQDGRLWIVYGN